MSLNLDSAATPFFTVLGTAYVQEHHFENRDDRSDCILQSGNTALPTNAGSWLTED